MAALLAFPFGAKAMPSSIATPTAVPTDVPLAGGSPDSDNPRSLYDGYWWREESWVPGWISVGTWFTPAPLAIQGRAVYYAPGIMEATARVRGMSLSGYVDGVSLMSPADIGRTVWIKRTGGWEGPFLVVDCARRNDMYGVVVGRREVVEVGFQTAEKWGMAHGTGGAGYTAYRWSTDEVTVYIGDKPPTIPVNPIIYKDWFLERVEFVTPAQDRAQDITVSIMRGMSNSACWKWYDGEFYCTEDYRTAPWVRPLDYLQPWQLPTATPTPTRTPIATATPTATPAPTATPMLDWNWRGNR